MLARLHNSHPALGGGVADPGTGIGGGGARRRELVALAEGRRVAAGAVEGKERTGDLGFFWLVFTRRCEINGRLRSARGGDQTAESAFALIR